ncbi:hypothetical protein ACQCSX_02925 [Pseudarthrobacter sp. P1]|uniref:hypothetical protein n=1 Tax=Pseudarthrobacter sp. P1 TaxID=3418418 RepID=UPI003CF2CB42
MPVAIIMEFNGATLAQYDEVIQKMGLTPGGPGPACAISHWVAATDAGILVTDVWQTRELYDAFAQDQIGPFSTEAGIPEPPTLTYHELHNYFTAGSDA